jgi:dihydrodipicolinate synthase/N-acetylneuraminate lyase
LSAFAGLMPILPAPFLGDGSLDLDGLQSVIAHIARTGVDGVVLFGLVTEYYKLSENERAEMVLVARQAVPAGCKLVVSITAHATDLAVRDAAWAAHQGVDAVMIMPPFFLQPSVAAVDRHIRRVAATVPELPVIVQYSPAQTGLNLTAEMFAQWNQAAPNLRYVKVESSPPGPACSRIAEESGGRIGCFVGYAGLQWPDALRRTAAGCMPSCGFIEPYVRMRDLFLAGRLAEADQLHRLMLPLINHVMQGIEMVIQCEKVLLKQRGWIASDYCREPAYALDAQQRSELLRLYAELTA